MAIRDIGPLALQAAQQRAAFEMETNRINQLLKQRIQERALRNLENIKMTREQRAAKREADKKRNIAIGASVIGGLLTGGIGLAASGAFAGAGAGVAGTTTGMAGNAAVGYGVTGGMGVLGAGTANTVAPAIAASVPLSAYAPAVASGLSAYNTIYNNLNRYNNNVLY